MIIKKEDVLGITGADGGIVCVDCMTEQDWNEITPKTEIMAEDIPEGEIWFCDKCEDHRLN